MRRILLLIALVIPFSAAAQKKVTASVEITPNYIWHVFALSNLWDRPDSPYSDRYGRTIPEADKQFMYEHRDLIAWGGGIGRGGMLAGGLFMVRLQNEITPEDYFTYLEEAQNQVPDSLYDICVGITRVMKKNYARFEKKVWPQIESDLLKAKGMIEARFEGVDPISRWEENLHREYEGSGKTLVLTCANWGGCRRRTTLARSGIILRSFRRTAQ